MRLRFRFVAAALAVGFSSIVSGAAHAVPVMSFGDASIYESFGGIPPGDLVGVDLTRHGFIGGSGIGNGGFALLTDTDAGFQLGLRANERFFTNFLPNDGIMTYFAEAGDSPTSGSDPTPAVGLATWDFQFHVDIGSQLRRDAALTYTAAQSLVDDVILAIDYDAGFGAVASLEASLTDAFTAAPPLGPGLVDPVLMQGSQNIGFGFLQTAAAGAGLGAFLPFDPHAPGEYTFTLRAEDMNDEELGSLSIKVVVVPEPSMLALFGIGLAGLGLMRRRRVLA